MSPDFELQKQSVITVVTTIAHPTATVRRNRQYVDVMRNLILSLTSIQNRAGVAMSNCLICAATEPVIPEIVANPQQADRSIFLYGPAALKPPFSREARAISEIHGKPISLNGAKYWSTADITNASQFRPNTHSEHDYSFWGGLRCERNPRSCSRVPISCLRRWTSWTYSWCLHM